MLADLEARWKMAAGFLLPPKLPVSERHLIFVCYL